MDYLSGVIDRALGLAPVATRRRSGIFETKSEPRSPGFGEHTEEREALPPMSTRFDATEAPPQIRHRADKDSVFPTSSIAPSSASQKNAPMPQSDRRSLNEAPTHLNERVPREQVVRELTVSSEHQPNVTHAERPAARIVERQ